MNKVILLGRMCRDAEVRYSQGDSSTAIARFSLAVDRRFKRDGDEQTADFINCVAFGNTAEFLEKYGKKGTKFVVEGRIQTGSYTNKDGVRVFTTDVVVESCEFAESKAASGSSSDNNSSNNNNNGYQNNNNSNFNNNYPGTGVDADGFMNIPDGVDDEGLPFM